MDHLTETQIEGYVSRRAPVDDLLSAAQHLETCFDCRDRATALVDPGDAQISHVRKVAPPAAEVTEKRSIVPWILGAVVVIALAAWLLLG
ncbi:MAG TPA: hypothetical protein VF698_21030 [Thermoanaerobaculia bacterium]|jgi:hypothetical protein